MVVKFFMIKDKTYIYLELVVNLLVRYKQQVKNIIDKYENVRKIYV